MSVLAHSMHIKFIQQTFGLIAVLITPKYTKMYEAVLVLKD